MPYFNCPECGNKVDTSATHCPECGFEFRYCAECNKVFSGKIEKCPTCGKRFVDAEEIVPQVYTSQHTDTSSNVHISQNTQTTMSGLNSELENDTEYKDTNVRINKIWEKKNQLESSRLKFIGYAPQVLGAIASVLIVIMFITFFDWKNGDPLEGVLNIDKVHDKIQAMIYGSMVCGILGVLVKLYVDIARTMKSIDWIRREKIDVIGYLTKYLDLNNEDPLSKLVFGISKSEDLDTIYLSAFPNKSMIYKIYHIIGAIVFGVLEIGIASELATVMDNVMQAVFLGEAYSVDYMPFIIWAVVAFGVLIVREIFFHFAISRNAAKWAREEFKQRNIIQ